ncbi:unnamed protein product, partial [Darwinula stevensoni]
CYLSIPFALSFTIPTIQEENKISLEILLVFCMIWVSDSAAYFVGSFFGKHKLAPRISENKTIEGFFGGVAGVIITGYIIQNHMNLPIKGNWIIISVIVAIAAPMGDLVESKLKRVFNVKDSSQLIPGHGDRNTVAESNQIVAPADGKVVIIRKEFEKEYLKKECIQVSIFMSPLNVHVNRYPLSGKVVYTQYHPGKYLFAWLPKSSELNERTSVVVKHENGQEILFRQIAGALARRIVLYSKINDSAEVGEDYGFIKFGSRVDIFLPLGTKILAKVGDEPVGGETIIAELNKN